MKTVNLFPAALLLVLLAGSAWAVQPNHYLDARDYGANGTDTLDDTKAIQDALDAAVVGDYAPRSVYIPAGKYYISSTLILDNVLKDNNMEIFGAGGQRWGAAPAGTALYWTGPAGGDVIKLNYVAGLRMHDLYIDGDAEGDGKNEAGTIINIDNICSYFHLANLELYNGETGIMMNEDPMNSDMTFTDLLLSDMKVAFHTRGYQNVNYVFIRCMVNNVHTGLYFEKGGSVYCADLYGANVGTAIKIDKASAGGGAFVFDSTKIETQAWKEIGHRTIILETGPTAGGNVTFTGLVVNHIGAWDDLTTPIFKIAGRMSVLVQNSVVYGCKVATLTGNANEEPSFLVFDMCKFDYGYDPREAIAITRTGNSVLELRNCTYGNARVPYTLRDDGIVAPPPTPQHVNVTNLTATSATLNWDAIPAGVSGFRVDLYDATTKAWRLVTDTLEAKATSHTVGNLTPATKYYLRVRAKRGTTMAVGEIQVVTTPAGN